MMIPDRAARIAYFSMEIGLEAGMPTYAGGLGILAGDTIRAAADLRIPVVAVSLLHREGYFYQTLDSEGLQHEEPVFWQTDDFLQEEPQRVSVTIEGRAVYLRAWTYHVTGVTGHRVPVHFLDSNVAENREDDRSLTDDLYGGDPRYRLCQEVILGMGGVRLLQALGYSRIERFHMNEGHAALLGLELLEQEADKNQHANITDEDLQTVRKKCVFTTHTPVGAGQDRFTLDLAEQVLGKRKAFDRQDVFCCEGRLNMTFLALNLSHFVNGVAKRHGETSRLMFARYSIDAITNGVHAATWIAEPFQQVFDAELPAWRQDNFNLRYAWNISSNQIWKAHVDCKKHLLRYVNQHQNSGMDLHVFTIGFARRATAYKRPDLLFHDLQRLKNISRNTGAIQVIYAGKAHPADEEGKELIQKIFRAKKSLHPDVKVVYLENYDMQLAQMITAGVDLWLNTPRPPLEASGTSGMKAAMNGVPSLSILDGWWIEGHVEGVTGWSIGALTPNNMEPPSDEADAASLYDKLENTILPMFYKDRDQYLKIMLQSIALNGSFFNSQRMLLQYLSNAYFRME